MLNYKLTPRDGFAMAMLTGLVSIDAWGAVLEDLASQLTPNVWPPRLVIDLTAVLGYLGIPERKAVGTLMARHLGGMVKVALVVQAHKITDVVFREAQSNGLNLRLFPDYNDAAEWVISESS